MKNLNEEVSRIKNIMGLNEQSMDEADVNAVAGKVTSIQQGMKYFFDNLSKLEYGQWYNVPNDPLAGKADVYNEQRMLGGAAGGGIMTCDNGRRMFYRKANPETPQQKKLYFFIKYDREVGPNGPVPRVYWMWSSGGSETPLSIVSVAGAQDVLKKLSMMGLNEQSMDMGGFKEGPGEKPKPDVDHFNKIVKPQLLNAGFKLSDDKSLSPYGTRLSLIYGDHNTGVNVIYFQPQGKSWSYKVWVGKNKNYKEFPLGGINDVQKTATNVVKYALSLKGTPTQYNEEESMDEQIGGVNDKAQGDVFKRFPQNSNQNQSQQSVVKKTSQQQIDPNRKKYFDALAQQITSKLIGKKIWFNKIGVLEGGQSVTIKSYADRSHAADLVNEPLTKFVVWFNVTRDKEDLYKSEKPGTRVWQGYVSIKLDLKNPNTPIVELYPSNDLSNKMVPTKPLTWNEVGGQQLWMSSTKFNTKYN
jgi:hypothetical protein